MAFGSVRSCGVTTLALSAWPPPGRRSGGCCWSRRTRRAARWPRRRGGRPSRAWCRWPRRPDGAATRPWCGSTATSCPAGRRCWPGRPRPSRPAARSGCSARCWAVSVSSTPTCWSTAAGSTPARPLSGCGSGRTGWCWRSGLAWPTCTPWRRGSKAALPTVARLGLVTVGDGPYPDAEIAEALGVEVLARLPWDPDAAEAPWCRCRRRPGSCAWRRWSGPPGRWPTSSPPS